MEKRQQTEMRLIVLFGILQQLMTTRQNKLLAHQELTRSQLTLLIHFTHKPERSWMVTELAEVMEMNQPGITKIVNVLINKHLLSVETDKTDRRKRHLKITDKGLKACSTVMASLLPDVSYIFEQWQDEDLSTMRQHLEQMMGWLDNHRDDIRLIQTDNP